MNRAKIEKHGYFFRNGRLRTECKCGCVYLTKAKNVKQYADYPDYKPYFETECPECMHENKQYLEALMKEKKDD